MNPICPECRSIIFPAPETDTVTHANRPIDGKDASIPARDTSETCPLTPWQLAQSARFRAVLAAAEPWLAENCTVANTAKAIGTSAGKLYRLLEKCPVRFPTPAGERCRRLLALDADRFAHLVAPETGGNGRVSDWEFVLALPGAKEKLRELYLATIGASSAAAANDRRTAKLSKAIHHFSYEPECPEALRAKLRAGAQPAPFVRYLRAAVPPELEARVRGPKHAQLYGASSGRDWTARLPDGTRFEIPAAWTLSMDDMSVNHPFYVEHPAGPILSRQGIYALWAKHSVWQSVELVARARESYTAADIARAFYKMCRAMGGVPHYVEFEQAIWKAKLLSGFTFDGGWLVEEPVERPAMSDAEKNSLRDGLALAGVTVLYKTKAHQKHIETHFNPLQDVIAIVARQFQCIGRYAGEFEHGSKQLRRVRAGSHHPRDLGFAAQAQLADRIFEAFTRTNDLRAANGKTRLENHLADLAGQPLLPLSPRLFAACLPGQPRRATLRGGLVSVQIQGRRHDFRADEFARLGDGYELLVRVDETDPNLGAAIFNGTSPANSANHGLGRGRPFDRGEFICCAPREIPGPKLNVATAPAGVRIETVEERYGAGALDTGADGRRRHDKFVATEFRSLRAGGLPGQPAVRVAAARDGQGRVVTLERSAPQTAAGCSAAAILPQLPAIRPRPTRSAGASDADFDRQAARLERDERRALAHQRTVLIEDGP